MRKSQILKEVKEYIKKHCVNYYFNINEEEIDNKLEMFMNFQLDLIKISYIDEVYVNVRDYDDYLVEFEIRLYRSARFNNRKIYLGELNLYITLCMDGE